jgi:hypothetical protein
MGEFFFKISDVTVSVEADAPLLFDTVKTFFSGYKFNAAASGKHRVTLCIYAGRKSPALPDTKNPVLFSYGRINGYRLDNGILLLSDKSTSVLVDEDRDRADAYVDMSILKRGTEFVSIFITIALIELLRHHGLYYLHAGAISKGKNQVLLCGMGMSGKTTLALGLLSRGYKLCSDDAVFLKREGNTVHAVGFKKDIHVTGETLRLYKKEFRDTKPPAPPFHKTFIPYSRFHAVDRVIPRTIFFLQPGKRQDTRILSLESTQAMSMLIPQSLMMFFHKDRANKHISILNVLIHQSKSYLCLCGRDLLKDPLIIFKSIGNK